MHNAYVLYMCAHNIHTWCVYVCVIYFVKCVYLCVCVLELDNHCGNSSILISSELSEVLSVCFTKILSNSICHKNWFIANFFQLKSLEMVMDQSSTPKKVISKGTERIRETMAVFTSVISKWKKITPAFFSFLFLF